MNYFALIPLIFLTILSAIDIRTFNSKKHFIPSYMTTSYLLIMFIFFGASHPSLTIFAFLIGLLLTDLEAWKGVADFKVFIGTAMFYNTIFTFIIFKALLLLTSLIYRIFYKKAFPKAQVLPLIPAFAISLLVSLLFI